MSGVAKKLLGQTAAYGVSSIVGRFLNYLLVPLHTYLFNPEAYGVVGALYAYVGFFNVLYIFGLETAFFRFANSPDADRQLLYNRVLSFLLFSSVTLTTLVLIFLDPISRLINFPDQKLYIAWLAIILAIDAITAIPFAKLRLENKPVKFAGIKITNILINVVGNLFIYLFCHKVYFNDFLPALKPLVQTIYYPEWGIGYIFLINLIANILLIPLLWREFAGFKFSLNFNFMKPLLQYGYPIMFMGFAGMVNELIDRILLLEILPEGFYLNLSTKAAVGVYNACYKLAIFMSLAIQAFRYAGEPFFFSQAKDKNSPTTFALVMKWFVIVCALIFLTVSVNIEDFKLLIGKSSYYQGLPIVPILLLANLFLGVYYNLSTWFKLTDRTHFGTYIGFGGAAITVILNILLIPILGFMGSAWATLVCYFSMAVVCYLFGQKYYPIPYPVLAILSYIGLAIGLVIIGKYVLIDDFWLRHGFHLGLCAAYILVILVVEKPWLKPKI